MPQGFDGRRAESEDTQSAESFHQQTLDTLRLGERAVITAVISSNPVLRNKLLSMGIVTNTPVQVTNVAPLNDPIGISVRGFKLCLRRSEARSILIRVDND